MPIDALPDDLDALRALVNQLSSERDTAIAESRRLTEQNDQLRHLLKQLQRAQFGQRSERLDHDQMQLALEDIETSLAERDAEEEENKKSAADKPADQRKTRRINRGALPAHLPHVHVRLEPESIVCPCCHGAMHVIGEESSQRLDKIPAQYQVIVTHRPKFGCRACEGAIVQAPAPERLIKSGIPTEALVASVVVDKFAWHNPLYRQAQIMKLQGLPVDRSTLAFWVGVAAAELKPVYLRMKEILLGSAKIAVDETRAPVLDPGRGGTKTGYFWAISRDDRPWGGSDCGVLLPMRPAEAAACGRSLRGYSGTPRSAARRTRARSPARRHETQFRMPPPKARRACFPGRRGSLPGRCDCAPRPREGTAPWPVSRRRRCERSRGSPTPVNRP